MTPDRGCGAATVPRILRESLKRGRVMIPSPPSLILRMAAFFRVHATMWSAPHQSK